MSHIKPTLDDKIQSVVINFLRLSLIAGIVLFIAQGEAASALLSLLALALATLPEKLEDYFGVEFPIEFTLIIVAFMYFTLFLGSVHGAYEQYVWWDAVLHTLSGVILGFTGFLMLIAFLSQGQVNKRPALFALFAFMFAVASGALWEVFEFMVDQFLGTDMQKSLVDTMGDLIVDAAGALFVSVLAYQYAKRGSINFVSRLVENFLNRNPHIRR